MIKIRLKDSGKVKEVERNEAHALIDKKEAELVTELPPKKDFGYSTRQLHPKYKHKSTL